MKKLVLVFVFVLLASLPVFSQTNKSANSNRVLPPKAKLRLGLALDNKPPSSTMRSANVDSPKTSTQRPTKTPDAGVQTFRIVEKEQKMSFFETEKPLVFFFIVIILLALVGASGLYRHTHPKTKRTAVRRYKDKRFSSPEREREGSAVFDHESDFH